MEKGLSKPFSTTPASTRRSSTKGLETPFSLAYVPPSKSDLLDNFPILIQSTSMTTTTLSSKGQVVLPRIVRSKLHLAPGTKLLCEIQGDSVVLTPEHPRSPDKGYVTDPLTGLRVTKRPEKSELVTSEMVKALLAGFP